MVARRPGRALRPTACPRNAAGDIIASGNRFDHTANTTHIEVGAHTAHMKALVSCGACHVVPAKVNAPDHNTGKRATVTFKELAAAGNVIPSTWVPAVHTCTNYCHGASLNHGGTNQTPDWLGGPAAALCGTCHFASGVTPPAAHPQGTGAAGEFASTAACAACHPDTVNADGKINDAGGKHVNGQLDGGGGHSAGWVDPAQHGRAANGGLQNCTSCHGADFAGNGVPAKDCNTCHANNGHPNWKTECTFCHGLATRAPDGTFPNVGTGTVVRANLAAPPVGTQGENAITAYAVGAHDAHVGGGTFARAAQCSECHGATLPVDITHVNQQIVLGWSATASNGVAPTPAAATNYVRWSDATGVVPNCTNFCHGATLAGGTHTSPKWNEGAAGASLRELPRHPAPLHRRRQVARAAAGLQHLPPGLHQQLGQPGRPRLRRRRAVRPHLHLLPRRPHQRRAAHRRHRRHRPEPRGRPPEARRHADAARSPSPAPSATPTTAGTTATPTAWSTWSGAAWPRAT